MASHTESQRVHTDMWQSLILNGHIKRLQYIFNPWDSILSEEINFIAFEWSLMIVKHCGKSGNDSNEL